MPRLVAMCGRNRRRRRRTPRAASATRAWCTDWRRCWRTRRSRSWTCARPDSEHSAPSIAAAQRGKHVICEKPLAMTVKDARAMAEAAQEGRREEHALPQLPVHSRGAPGPGPHRQGRHRHGSTISAPSTSRKSGHDPAAPLEDCWYAIGNEVRCPPGDRLAHHRHGAVPRRGDRDRERPGDHLDTTSRTTRAGAARRVTADEGNIALVEFACGATGTLESSGVATGRKNTQGGRSTGRGEASASTWKTRTTCRYTRTQAEAGDPGVLRRSP